MTNTTWMTKNQRLDIQGPRVKNQILLLLLFFEVTMTSVEEEDALPPLPVHGV